MLPYARIERLKVKMLNQVGLESLTMTFGHELVKQIDITYARWLLVELSRVVHVRSV